MCDGADFCIFTILLVWSNIYLQHQSHPTPVLFLVHNSIAHLHAICFGDHNSWSMIFSFDDTWHLFLAIANDELFCGTYSLLLLKEISCVAPERLGQSSHVVDNKVNMISIGGPCTVQGHLYTP